MTEELAVQGNTESADSGTGGTRCSERNHNPSPRV
jgi:hypothetical protein